MLTVDLLAENHRRIYEAVRDAGKPISPKDIEDATGLPGSTVRPTLGVMLEKNLLRRPIYGLYTVVPLDKVGEEEEDPDTIIRQGYEALVQSIPHAVALLDTELTFLSVNDAYLEAWDLSGRDIIGQTMYEVFPDVSQEGRLRLDRVLAGETVYTGDPEPYPWKRADGRVYWSRLRMFPWHNETGDVAGIVVMCSTSLDANNVPSLGVLAPAGKTDTESEKQRIYGVDKEGWKGYAAGAHHRGEDMHIPTEFLVSMGAAAVAVAIDPEAFRVITEKMTSRKRYKLRVVVEEDDEKEPPPPKE